MDPKAGRRYRYQVLEPGSSRAETEILKDFLGREPSCKTILDELCQWTAESLRSADIYHYLLSNLGK